MALTFYRGNVNLPSGGDPIAEVSAALRERRLRQQQIEDEERRRAGVMDQQRQTEQMTRDRMLEIHRLDNDADMQRALATRKDALAARAAESQRKSVPGIQTQLGKGNADAARAAALAAGIDDFDEAPAAQVEFGDAAMAPGENMPDPNAPKKFGFSVGDQRQEFELAPPAAAPDYAASAATLDDYKKHRTPEIQRLARAYSSQVSMGQVKPGQALADLAAHEARLRGQNMSASTARQNARRNDGGLEAGDSRLLGEAHRTISQIGQMQDVRGAIESERNSRQMLQDLQSNNDAQIRRAFGVWAKEASGPGAVQASERDEFVNNVGGRIQGIEKRIAEWMQPGGEAKMPKEQLQIFADSLSKTLIPRSQARLRTIGKRVNSAFAKHPAAKLRTPEFVDWATEQVVGDLPELPQAKEQAGEQGGGEIDEDALVQETVRQLGGGR